jgi:hypothetical protein
MNAGIPQLGRVLVLADGKTRTRPSFRPPPNLASNIELTKGRSAALRHFGSQRNSREVRPMTGTQ